MLSTLDPFYSPLYSFGSGLFNPLEDWDITLATSDLPARRQRRRPMNTAGQPASGRVAQTDDEVRGRAALTAFSGEDVAFLNFDRLLNEPLSMSLMDRDKHYILLVAQPPDLRKKDLKAELNQGVLTISGSRQIEEGGRSRWVSYHRCITLPDNIYVDGIEAKYNSHGILEVTLPKLEGKQRKKITIQGAEEVEQKEKQTELGKQKEMGGMGGMGGMEDKETLKESERGQEPSQKQQQGDFGRQIPVGNNR